MKKVFVTAVAQQFKFTPALYQTDNAELKSNREEHYPIFNALENTIEPDDDIEFIIIKLPCEKLDENFMVLKERVAEFEAAHKTTITLTTIERGLEETENEHIILFNALTDALPKNCDIYADITYGTKPTPMIVFAALRFVSAVRPNTDVRLIVYGQIEKWKKDETGDNVPYIAHIYDITRLLRIISITENLTQLGGSDVEGAVKMLLNTTGG
jgi:hypothetical protein